MKQEAYKLNEPNPRIVVCIATLHEAVLTKINRENEKSGWKVTHKYTQTEGYELYFTPKPVLEKEISQTERWSS